MAILILSRPIPSAPFVEAFHRLAPGLPVWTDADEAPSDAVQAVLAWRLAPGQLARFPRLRVLCATGAGVDKLRLDELPASLPVTRAVDPQQAQGLAQYVLAMALQHLREWPRYAAQQAQAQWARHPQRPLGACRLGLLGQGEVAQAVAQAALALGLPTSLWGRSERPLPATLAAAQRLVGDAGLPALLAQSDVLVNTLPLTPATQDLLNLERLSLLPRGAYLINIGRGEHLVEADLRTLLDSGALAGAALDVHRQEPLPAEHWAWHHPQVVCTPHIAGEARFELAAAQCLAAWQAVREGRTPTHLVDRLAGY